MKSCIDFYDDSADTWAEEWYSNEMMIPYLKELLSAIGKKKPRILDLCCGAGYESMRLKNLGASVVGVDLSEKSLEIARQKNPDIPFYNKDMRESYADLGMFDGILCNAGIIHIEESELYITLKNMAEVLHKGGYLLLVYKEGNKRKDTTSYNGVEYARNSIPHTQSEIVKYGGEYFSMIKDLTKEEGTWKFCLYKRK